MNKWFSAFAQWTSQQSGKSYTFVIACLIIVIWAATGPYYAYSDSWQLVMNSATTAITFLMVFLLQNSQVRDSTAMQLKLNELIRVTKEARNHIINIEDSPDQDLVDIKQEFRKNQDDSVN